MISELDWFKKLYDSHPIESVSTTQLRQIIDTLESVGLGGDKTDILRASFGDVDSILEIANDIHQVVAAIGNSKQTETSLRDGDAVKILHFYSTETTIPIVHPDLVRYPWVRGAENLQINVTGAWGGFSSLFYANEVVASRAKTRKTLLVQKNTMASLNCYQNEQEDPDIEFYQGSSFDRVQLFPNLIALDSGWNELVDGLQFISGSVASFAKGKLI